MVSVWILDHDQITNLEIIVIVIVIMGEGGLRVWLSPCILSCLGSCDIYNSYDTMFNIMHYIKYN